MNKEYIETKGIEWEFDSDYSKIDRVYSKSHFPTIESFLYHYKDLLTKNNIDKDDLQKRVRFQRKILFNQFKEHPFSSGEKFPNEYERICFKTELLGYPSTEDFKQIFEIYDFLLKKENRKNLDYNICCCTWYDWPNSICANLLFYENLDYGQHRYRYEKEPTFKYYHTKRLPINYSGLVPYLYLYGYIEECKKAIDLVYKFLKYFPEHTLLLLISLFNFTLFCGEEIYEFSNERFLQFLLQNNKLREYWKSHSKDSLSDVLVESEIPYINQWEFRQDKFVIINNEEKFVGKFYNFTLNDYVPEKYFDLDFLRCELKNKNKN